MRGVTLSLLITAALTGRPYNQNRLGDAVKRYARKISNRACPKLPDDLHDEIAQQAIVELLAAGPGGLATRSGQALLRRAVLSAIRVVRSDYAEPGRLTRPPVKGTPEPIRQIAAEQADAIVDADTMARITDIAGGDGAIDLDRLESPAAAFAIRRKEDEVELDWALRRATPTVAAALRLVCVEGETLATAAVAVSLSRFTLSRRMDAFCPRWRDAA